MGVKRMKLQEEQIGASAYDELRDRIAYQLLPPTSAHFIACAREEGAVYQQELQQSLAQYQQLSQELVNAIVTLKAELEPYSDELDEIPERTLGRNPFKHLWFWNKDKRGE